MKRYYTQLLKIIFPLVLFILSWNNLKAQDFIIYGITGNVLINIDPLTGDATEVATLTPGYSGFSSLTYEPNLDQLLGVADAGTEPKLVSIDRCSGDISEIGLIDQISPFIDFKLMESLEYNANDGLLYAAGYTLNPPLNNWFRSRTFMTVDPLTGNATVIDNITGTCDQEFDRMAFTSGATYAMDRCGGAYLYLIDVTDGSAVSLIGTNSSTSSNICASTVKVTLISV